MSEVTNTEESQIKSFWSFFKTHLILAYLFLIWGALLLTRIIYNKQKFIINTIADMSHGNFKPFQKEIDDPIFSKIQDEIISFSNQHLNRVRTFSKQIKLHHLRSSSIPGAIQESGFRMYNSVILQIDFTNFESVFYDYKFQGNLGELNSLWANICEMLEDKGAIVDDLSGGSIRALWSDNEVNREHLKKIAILVFEIQDLIHSINKHRFMHNSSPYKITMALHIGELILTQLGPLERKEFTGIGPCLAILNNMLYVAKINQSSIIVSEQIFEFLNPIYLFTVLTPTATTINIILFILSDN